MKTTLLAVVFLSCINIYSFGQQEIKIDLNSKGRTFEGLGSLSAGASSRLLIDYPEPYRGQILDMLFKPKFGASLQHLKVEIGGDINSTCGAEPSHARTRQEMLYPQKSFYNRGYEWWLMQEAKKRNPHIMLDCLEWGLPDWVGNHQFYSDDNINYIISFIKGAKKYHHLEINYTGIHNERMYDANWIKKLRSSLNTSGLSKVKIVGADLCCNDQWKIADDIVKDSVLKSAVAVIGDHYPEKDKGYNSSDNAKQTGLPLWDSEGGPWRGDGEGFKYLAKMFNRNYIEGRMTKNVTWSLITSYYNNLALPNSGMMKANTPWSGSYQVQPAIWAFAHTTQFVQPGWQYLDDACGYLKEGSYVTLQSGKKAGTDLSLIIETMDAKSLQPITIRLPANFCKQFFYVWKSKVNGEEFKKIAQLAVHKNAISITLDTNSLYSITTTQRQSKGSYKNVPAEEPFPLPFCNDFNSEVVGTSPKYFSDQAGAFEISRDINSSNKCLKQTITKPGNEWEGNNSLVETVIGDTSWKDYTVSVNVFLTKDTMSYGAVIGRALELHRSHQAPEAYWLKLYSSGNWQLLVSDSIVCKGLVKNKQGKWVNLKLTMYRNRITAFINQQQIVSVLNSKFTHGLCGLGSSYDQNLFDKFSVKKGQKQQYTLQRQSISQRSIKNHTRNDNTKGRYTHKCTGT